MKKTAFWGITLLFPFLLLILIELALRLFGYNEQGRHLFTEMPQRPGYVVTNPDFVSRYFPSFKPEFAISPFQKDKADNTFRVFVLGGSSAQGFPYHFYHSFSGRLDQLLQMETQSLNIEVINLGMTAVNSYVIRDISKRIVPYEPDAVVIYAGHNEYYGSFGVGSTQFGLGRGIFTKRLIIRLKDFALYQLLENMLKPAQSERKGRTMMAEVVKESAIEFESETFHDGIAQFRENMSDVLGVFLGNGIPVYIGTVTSNLKDQAPFGENEKAREEFGKGSTYLESGNTDSAAAAFAKAKEWDGIRFRAPDEINTVIRELAVEHDAVLADVFRVSADSSESGIPDDSFFDDHLHPNWRGHQIIGELFFGKLKSHPVVETHYLSNPMAGRVPISRFEETYSAIPVIRLKSAFPFKKGLSEQEEERNFQKAYRGYLNKSFVDSVAASTWMDRTPVPLALRNVVNYYSRQGDTLSVARHYVPIVNWQGINEGLLRRGMDYFMQNRRMDNYSAYLLHMILNEQSRDPYFYNTITSLYLLNGDLERGEYWLKQSERRNPNSSHLFYNYARYYNIKGDMARAGEYYQRYLDARGN